MKLKLIIYSICLLHILTGCNEPVRIDPVQKEQEVLAASNPSEYEEDGETIKDYYRSDRTPLIEWVQQDTATLSYPFTSSIQNEYVTLATSADGNLRVYTWDTGDGGTMICWGNIIQYRSGKKVKAEHKSLYAVLHPNESGDSEMDFGSHIDTIKTLYTDNGQAIYLVDEYFRESGNLAYTGVMALNIQNGKLKEYPCFNKDGDKIASIGTEHTISDWYFSTNLGEGWDWLNRYDTANQDLYMPVTNDMQSFTDQYQVWHFDGKQFTLCGQSGPFWIYPGLREFDELCLLFETKHYRVRIDKMKDSMFRYASWERGVPMSEKPELILKGGKLANGSYVFENGRYKYIIHCDKTKNVLEVRENGKVILKETQLSKY